MEPVQLRVTADGFTRPDPSGQVVNTAVEWKDLGGFREWMVRRLTGPEPGLGENLPALEIGAAGFARSCAVVGFGASWHLTARTAAGTFVTTKSAPRESSCSVAPPHPTDAIAWRCRVGVRQRMAHQTGFPGHSRLQRHSPDECNS